MEAERSPVIKKTIKKLKKPKPVVESSSFVRDNSYDQPRSLTKLRKLKPIAHSQVQIQKTQQPEPQCDSGSQGTNEIFRETASFNKNHKRVASRSSHGSAFNSFNPLDTVEQAENNRNDFGNLSLQKQKSSPPQNTALSFASPSPKDIPLAHRTFAIVDSDSQNQQNSILQSIEKSPKNGEDNLTQDQR